MSLEKLFSGKRVWIYFTLLVIAALGMFSLYTYNIIRWRNSPDFGWRTMYDSGPNFVAEVFARGEEAGLRVGDTILAINGQTYNSFDELFFKIRHPDLGSVNSYAVVRDGKTVEINITTGRLGLKTVLKRSGFLFMGGLIYAIIGTLVFLMKSRARESLLFLVMTYLIGIRLSYAGPSDLFHPLTLFDIRNLFNIFLPASLIHLALRFPKTRTFIRKRPWLLAIPYLFSLILFVLMEAFSTAYWNIPSTLILIYNLYTLITILVFLISIVWNFLKDPSVLIQLQSKVIFLGIIIGFFIPAGDLVLRSLLKIYVFPDPALGFAVFMTAFPLSIGYTIIRHDLFAIDTIIKRTYGYILTTGGIAGVYALFVFLTNLAFGRFEFTKSPLFPLIFILAVVFLFNPIRNRVQKFIDRVFYRLEYDYQETVQRISEALRSLLHLDQIGKSILDHSVGVMFIESGSVMVLNPKENLYESITEPSLPMKIPTEDPLIEKISTRKKEVTIYDIQEDPLFEKVREACKRTFEQLKATLIVPLIYEDRLTGLISLGSKKSGKFYRREDINLLKTLANQGAVALENARLFQENIEKSRMEEELKIAHNLQTSMLPDKAPIIEGFSIVARSIPAREVGGDFYDFIEITEKGAKRLGIVVGDVSGKAVSGALVMAASRSIFRVLTETNESVEEVMNRANARLHRDVKKGMFVALLYAVLDPKEKTMTFSNAGQVQPILCSPEKSKAEYIDTKGDRFPLGIVTECHYQEMRVSLKQGDILVFYTDGMVEAVNDKGELYGFERFLTSIEEGRELRADELLEKLINDIMLYVGKVEQHDDLTAVVVKVD